MKKMNAALITFSIEPERLKQMEQEGLLTQQDILRCHTDCKGATFLYNLAALIEDRLKKLEEIEKDRALNLKIRLEVKEAWEMRNRNVWNLLG